MSQACPRRTSLDFLGTPIGVGPQPHWASPWEGREGRPYLSPSSYSTYRKQNDLILILGFRSEKKGTQWVRPDRGLEAQTPGVPMEEGAGRKMPMFLLDSGSASPTQNRRDQPLGLQTQFLSLGVRWVQTRPFSASYKKCWRPGTEGSLTNPS